jgi:alpha-1,2-rhamnosyltransferase
MTPFDRILIDTTLAWQQGVLRGVPRVVNSFFQNKDQLESVYQCPAVAVGLFEGSWHFFKGPKEPGAATVPGPDDLFLNMDSWWALDHFRHVASLAERRVKVVSVVYDLIQITHSRLIEGDSRELFTEALLTTLKTSHAALCISKSVLTETRDFLSENGLKLASDFFYLGAHLSPTDNERPTKPLAVPTPFILAVGVVEPRKAYLELLSAFEAYCERDPSFHLVIVGHPGEKANLVLEKIATINRSQPRVFHFPALSDTQLRDFYQGADFVVCPSHAEGFGLPLAEAMMNQKKILANDIPIFHEIGGDYPVYFDIDEPKSFANALETAQRKTNWVAPPTVLQGWPEAVRQFALKSKTLISGGRND